jgi:hypothetical protein
MVASKINPAGAGFAYAHGTLLGSHGAHHISPIVFAIRRQWPTRLSPVIHKKVVDTEIGKSITARAQQGERMRRVGVLMGFEENDLEANAFLSAVEALRSWGRRGVVRPATALTR